MTVQENGFTVVGVLVTVAILCVLTVLIVPYVNNLRADWSLAKVRHLAGNMESGSARNHAIDVAIEQGLTTSITDPFVNVDNCTDGAFLLGEDTLPKGYTISSKEVGDQIAVACFLQSSGGKSVEFIIVGAQGGTSYATESEY